MEFCVDTLLLALNWPALFVNVYWSLLHHTHLFCMHWVEASAWPQSSPCGHQLCTHILCVSETPLVRSSRNFPLVFLSPLESILLPQHPLMRSFSGLPILPFFKKKDIRAKIQNYQLSQNVAMEGTRNSNFYSSSPCHSWLYNNQLYTLSNWSLFHYEKL